VSSEQAVTSEQNLGVLVAGSNFTRPLRICFRRNPTDESVGRTLIRQLSQLESLFATGLVDYFHKTTGVSGKYLHTTVCVIREAKG
jgi:hypothetical protein